MSSVTTIVLTMDIYKVYFVYISMRARYSELTKEILLYLAAAGAIVLAATSPYVVMQLTQRILQDKNFLAKQQEKWKIARLVRNLKRNRVILLKENNNGDDVTELTEKGKRIVKTLQLETLKIRKPKVWDRKWRIVIFDIPEEEWRQGRDALRNKLQQLGFCLIQKSVWVCPWPCENEILFISELWSITPFVNILTAERIYNDIALRKHFHLL